jgi:hypothetical protein
MSIRSKGLILAVGALSAVLGAGSALAQAHGGGGHSSGGGHFGGGGHAAAGGHFGGGAHFAPGGHVGAYRGAVGAGYAHTYPGGYHGAALAGHGAYGRPGGYYYGHGYSTGAYWRGGYWHGAWWPRAYYGLGFSWFLPVLPLAYATYWYGGVPYYYANDVYYTYNPDYEGYVATDPPPVGESDGSAPQGGAAIAPPQDGGSIPGQVFMYPKNGQSAEQQAQDKAECQQWAAQQAGQAAQNGADYRRAMTACVEGRGYSAQ